MNAYRTTASSEHERLEEEQWARLLAAGSSRCGMALVFIQKLCTAFHEFEPAWRAGALTESALDHFRRRLAARATKVIAALDANDLARIAGYDELVALTTLIASAGSLRALADLADPIHDLNHRLCEELERRALAE